MIKLKKGGIVIDTGLGPVQIGAPPETIKDSLALGREVPRYYIAPKKLFSHKKMSSFLDLEFPCYYNFFCSHQKTGLFCTEEQKTIIEQLMQESIFGPSQINLEVEYADGKKNPIFPDMARELKYFTKHPFHKGYFCLTDILDFVILADEKPVSFQNISLELRKETGTVIITDNNQRYELPWDLDYEDGQAIISNLDDIFIPPSFGITTLGSSHGFDPKGKTSGFIFWINGVGVMVDPPIDSSLWLWEENVDPKMVNSVILTHCHSDHDSGVMQKVLQEGRVTLYTTPTIFSSFVRKISLLTGLHEIDIVQLIDFIPVTIDKAININGAMVTFNYRLHSIPTIGFEIFFKGKNVVYTSDHMNDKNFLKQLFEQNILPAGRYQNLCDFNWDKDMIIHEAGVAPLHTPIDVLLSLPEQNKKNIYLVHTDKSKIPADSGLKISQTGLANTMVIDAKPTIHGESIQVLNLITGLDIFQEISFGKAAEFLSIIQYMKFKKGDCLIRQDQSNQRFFIIIAGKARLFENNEEKTILNSGSYFGENSIMSDCKAFDTIIALTDLITIVIEKRDFLTFISDTPIFERLRKLANVRQLDSWKTIDANYFFRTITINQKNNLEVLLEHQAGQPDEAVLKAGQTLDFAVFWQKGEGHLVDQNQKLLKKLKPGDYIGKPMYLLGEKKLNFSVVCRSECHFFKINWNDMLKFFHRNPRILLELRDLEKDENHFFH